MTISPAHLETLMLILDRLEGHSIDWALTGSLGQALQGLPVTPRDIDLQTDEIGVHAVTDLLSEWVVTPVFFKEGERARSWFAALSVGGMPVEVMGDIQHRLPDGGWDEPARLANARRWVALDGRYVPVYSLSAELPAYEALGRTERADLLRHHLAEHPLDTVEAITNYHVVYDWLGTGGMPLPDQIPALARAGYQTVINLALPELHSALPDEAERVRAAGMDYINLPVVWTEPTRANLHAFFAALAGLQGQKLFAHCVLNMRVSAFVYLYRVTKLGVPKEEARVDVERIWTPDGVWKQFLEDNGG
jgi:protein tyrosine phosphatase (PTP) superfamily phosphohydrolase (DUF442 family)